MWIWIAFLSVGMLLIIGVLIAALQCATARLTDECEGDK
jgi:hypothetical protein